MTNEQAIMKLKHLQFDPTTDEFDEEALDMAIEVLKETDMGLNNGDHLHPFGEPFGWTEEEIQKHGLRELLKEIDNKNDELSCSEEPNRSDTIYRQDAIELVKDVCDAIMSGCNSHYDSEVEDEVYDDILEVDAILTCNKEIRKALKGMPSAQPEPITVNIDHELAQDEYEKLRKDMENAPIMLLPSARPERKKGRWIPERLQCTNGGSYQVYRCDQCQEAFNWRMDFCGGCGADMRGGDKNGND